MTTHPSHTLQEVETGPELAVGLGAGGERGHGAPQAPLSGSLCAYSALEQGKTKPASKLLVYKTESLQLDYESDDRRDRSKGIKTEVHLVLSVSGPWANLTRQAYNAMTFYLAL